MLWSGGSYFTLTPRRCKDLFLSGNRELNQDLCINPDSGKSSSNNTTITMTTTTTKPRKIPPPGLGWADEACHLASRLISGRGSWEKSKAHVQVFNPNLHSTRQVPGAEADCGRVEEDPTKSLLKRVFKTQYPCSMTLQYKQSQLSEGTVTLLRKTGGYHKQPKEGHNRKFLKKL